ncbi:hypothetical protein [Paenibacillus alba]|uniref:RNA-dependent RNA polymerase n=1 Tax=Paenibacillus alba TaxID=1197127 RepID=A0ABU6G682_9BACL|nr:hypothetical protein [Paenibacillus alba]MEC0229672.1 hypothetical protein [Paenibacillus alba]
MFKQAKNLRYVYKINSSLLKKSKWNLSLNPNIARKLGAVVSLANSQAIDFIDDISKSGYSEDKVKELKIKITNIKKEKASKVNAEKITLLYTKLDELLFLKDYICVVFDKSSDFDRANKGFFFNDTRFTRLFGTTGGVKTQTIVYVSDRVGEQLCLRIDNGRNLNKEIVPAKLESYKSLISSASTRVTEPHLRGIIVVNDFEHEIEADIIKIKDNGKPAPSIEEVRDKVKLNASDGFGLISPELAAIWATDLGLDYIPGGFVVRNSFCKGTLFTFDFVQWAKLKAKTYELKDAWTHTQDISKAQIILTSGMLKLWSSYKNIEHYRECCQQNYYSFRVTKTTPKELGQENNLNYQFIQSLNLSDTAIDQLIKPTIDEITDVLGRDWRKSILYLKGTHLVDKNIETLSYDYAKALMIDEEMINDPFVTRKIREMIGDRIDNAKMGDIKVSGNYSILSGDPVALLESIFQFQEVKGLLKKGEFYSKYWIERGIHKVAAFRAPMTCHNNTRIFRFTESEEMRHWYKYMNGVTILNAWDTTTHALNGCDFDGDQIMTTSNEIIISGIKELKAIVCEQKNALPIIPSDGDLIIANKNSFGNEIGQITNSATSMYDKLAEFSPSSDEYQTLQSRIISCQHYQQNAIDKAKGIEFHQMPLPWFNYKANIRIDKETKQIVEADEFNIRILANKKPYFMIYRYEHLHSEYKQYMASTNQNALNRFGMNLEDLIKKELKTEEEQRYLLSFFNQMPVSMGNSIVNKICWKIEHHFSRRKTRTKKEEFDYSILMSSNPKYNKITFEKMNDLYEEYKYMTQSYMQNKKLMSSNQGDDEGEKDQRKIFTERFKLLSSQICSNEDELCNIIVKICYSNDKSKQFAWDVVGHTMINNLLKKNNYFIRYPELDENGEIEFCGRKFSMKSKNIRLDEESVHEYFAK